MRAEMERNQATGTDGWGNPLPPDYQPNGTLKCFAWSNQSREIVDGQVSALVEDMRAMFALDADIAVDDEISAVTDAAGTEIIPGRLRIEGAIQRKHTHLEVALKRLG